MPPGANLAGSFQETNTLPVVETSLAGQVPSGQLSQPALVPVPGPLCSWPSAFSADPGPAKGVGLEGPTDGALRWVWG